MLKPSMQDLMNRVNNRYLLVNLVAQRARDITLEAEAEQEKIPEKPVKLAIDEIAEGKIAYREGPKPEPAAEMAEILASVETPSAEDDITAADDILEEL